jgi:hypothetical protein
MYNYKNRSEHTGKFAYLFGKNEDRAVVMVVPADLSWHDIVTRCKRGVLQVRKEQ